MKGGNTVEKELVEDIVHTYSDSVLKVAYTYVKNTNDAEDIAQDVFLSLLDKDIEFDSAEHVKAWLIRATINKCKNHLKSSWFSKRTEMPEDISYIQEEDLDVLSAVMQLDEKYRIPIHLYYYEGYSINEISSIMHKKASTIGSYLYRGRKQLYVILGGRMF